MCAMDNLALLLHLLGVVSFCAGIALAGAAFEAARRRAAPAEVALLLGFARIGVLLVAAGAIVIPVFGVWLVSLGHFGYGAGWVDAAIALYVMTLVLGAIGGRTPKQARLLAAELAARGAPESTELRALLDDRTARAANYASAALVLAIIVLMVFKP